VEPAILTLLTSLAALAAQGPVKDAVQRLLRETSAALRRREPLPAGEVEGREHPQDPRVLLAVYNLAESDPELLAPLIAATEDPQLAVRLLVATQSLSERIRIAEEHGEDPGKASGAMLAALSDLTELDVSAGLRETYKTTLANGFPWADSESLETAALWCGLRDTLEPEDDEDRALRDDADFLNLLLGPVPEEHLVAR
jgi:hypothetical protein